MEWAERGSLRTWEKPLMSVEGTESSGDFDEVRGEGDEQIEGNRCAEAPWEGCFTLVIAGAEGKVELRFYLLSPKLDWAALPCARRGVFGQHEDCNLWPLGQLMLVTIGRSLLDMMPLAFISKSICFSKMSLWATDKLRRDLTGVCAWQKHMCVVTQLPKACCLVPKALVRTDDFSLLIHTSCWLLILRYVYCNHRAALNMAIVCILVIYVAIILGLWVAFRYSIHCKLPFFFWLPLSCH